MFPACQRHDYDDPMTRPWWQWALGWLGFAGLMVTLFFYVSSGLVAPGWAILVLLAVWLFLLVVSIQLLRQRRPLWVLPVPIVAFLFWFAALSAGETWLGWTP
jgi:hypothetical protein